MKIQGTDQAVDLTAINQIFEPIVDQLMTTEDFAPPADVLSPESWIAERRQELLDYLSNKTLIEILNKGSRAVFEDLEHNATPVQIKQIQEEWNQGLRNYVTYMVQNGKDHLQNGGASPQPTLFEMFKLSENTYVLFFQAAMRYYNSKQLQAAVDAFAFLTYLDHRRFNVWVFKGLSNKELGRFEIALQDFAMASITNIDSPVPYLLSGECCTELKEFDEAAGYLNLAYQAIEKAPKEQQSQFFSVATKLKKQIF